ncbi:hypothetical protein [Enterobacter asburiae]|uniref:hypothetical protein n=1 Tax=Enterobacter asburiae TaxID=61645 RepID=UPI003B24D6BD
MTTLTEFLVSELPKRGGWPNGASEAYRHVGDDHPCFYKGDGDIVAYQYGWSLNLCSVDLNLDADKHGETVTREQYEAALAASKEMTINKPDYDGWIPWRGGECPVDGDVVVDVKFRAQGQADLDGDFADNFRWEHFSNGADVVAYRLHKSEHHKPQWDGEGLPPVGTRCEFISNDTSWGEVDVIGIDGDKVVFKPSGETYYGIVPSQRHIFRPIRSEAERNRDEAVRDFVRQLIECVDLHATDKGQIDIVREKLYSMLPMLPGVTVID